MLLKVSTLLDFGDLITMPTTTFLQLFKLQIQDLLDLICPYLPAFEAECHFMVCNYIDEILEMIVNQYANPEEVCTAIGFCP